MNQAPQCQITAYVEQKEISLHPIKSSDQIANYLTKPLNVDQFT